MAFAPAWIYFICKYNLCSIEADRVNKAITKEQYPRALVINVKLQKRNFSAGKMKI